MGGCQDGRGGKRVWAMVAWAPGARRVRGLAVADLGWAWDSDPGTQGKGPMMGRVGEDEGGEGVCEEASRFDEELTVVIMGPPSLGGGTTLAFLLTKVLCAYDKNPNNTHCGERSLLRLHWPAHRGPAVKPAPACT